MMPGSASNSYISSVPLNVSDAQSAPQDDVNQQLGRRSYGKFYGYRARLRDAWSEFLQDSFDSPAHVAVTFQVNTSTAEKWWRGDHAPSAFAMGLAFSVLPSAARKHLAVQL